MGAHNHTTLHGSVPTTDTLDDLLVGSGTTTDIPDLLRYQHDGSLHNTDGDEDGSTGRSRLAAHKNCCNGTLDATVPSCEPTGRSLEPTGHSESTTGITTTPMVFLASLLVSAAVFALGRAWLPAACPRPSTTSLSGCLSFRPSQQLVCGRGLMVWTQGTALRRRALWKAGVRACRRWAPPTTVLRTTYAAAHGSQLTRTAATALCLLLTVWTISGTMALSLLLTL